MFAAFPIVLFIIGAVLLVALPVGISLQSYFRNRGRRTVICPDNHEPETVEIDSKFAFKTALRGKEHDRLQSCTRWPEKGDCDQECLAQVDPSPENLERLLHKWYQGKSCAICERPLTPADWRRSRLALLNENQKLFELRHMQLEEVPSALDKMKPLCWNCHPGRACSPGSTAASAEGRSPQPRLSLRTISPSLDVARPWLHNSPFVVGTPQRSLLVARPSRVQFISLAGNLT